jgi:phage terminase large subunit-like protein
MTTDNISRSQLEHLAMARTALQARQASDPLYTWQPHAKQRAFIRAVLGESCYENWLLAANRSGKSDAGAYCGATLARFGVEPTRPAVGPSAVVWDRATSGWVVCLDFPASRDVVQPKYFDNGFVTADPHPPFIPDREIAEWRISDQILKLKNGSLIGFKSCESGRKKFQGAGIDWIHIDEEPPKDVYTEITLRVGGARRQRIFGTCTLLPPEGQVGGVTWVYAEIAKPVIDGKRQDVGIFQASIYDNPHILPAEVARLEAKYPEGSIERRIRLDGELLPGLSGARAYTAFQYSLHVRELPPIEPRRPLCWTWDFNVSPMVSLISQRVLSSYTGQPQGQVFRVFDELILDDDASVPSMVELFKSRYPRHGAEIWIYGDATGRNRSGQTGSSYYRLILNGMRGYPVPVRLKVPGGNPHQPDRINAVNRALLDEYGFVGTEIAPVCEEFIADLEGVLRNGDGTIKKAKNPKDIYFRRTHTSDAWGYQVNVVQPVTYAPLGHKMREYQGAPGTKMRLPRYA